MRVRDDDGLEPPQLPNALHRVVVQVRDAVPEDVAAGEDAEDGALADGDLGHGVDADEGAVRRQRGQVLVVLHDDEFAAVFFGFLHCAEGCP